jgi:hypothetical protein
MDIFFFRLSVYKCCGPWFSLLHAQDQIMMTLPIFGERSCDVRHFNWSSLIFFHLQMLLSTSPDNANNLSCLSPENVSLPGCKRPSSEIPCFCEQIQKVPIKSGIGRRGICFRAACGGVGWSQTEVPTRFGFFPFIPKFALFRSCIDPFKSWVFGGTPFWNQAEHEGKPESSLARLASLASLAPTRVFPLPSGLRNGGRPWLGFEGGQFPSLPAFKKTPLKSGEFESVVRRPAESVFSMGTYCVFEHDDVKWNVGELQKRRFDVIGISDRIRIKWSRMKHFLFPSGNEIHETQSHKHSGWPRKCCKSESVKGTTLFCHSREKNDCQQSWTEIWKPVHENYVS